ncbi:MAG: hypothetical protein ABJD07_13225 [Gemmatimonadaceae bacterium]
MDQQHDDQQSAGYPIGRGYGNDYMRGGEVFGGYGYSGRDAYEATRGEHPDPNESPAEPPSIDALSGDPGSPPPSDDADATRSSMIDKQLAQIEHTFGSSGGNLRHSRSYYVAQAKLQQRQNRDQ